MLDDTNAIRSVPAKAPAAGRSASLVPQTSQDLGTVLMQDGRVPICQGRY